MPAPATAAPRFRPGMLAERPTVYDAETDLYVLHAGEWGERELAAAIEELSARPASVRLLSWARPEEIA